MSLPGESQGWGRLVGCFGVAQSQTRLKRLSSSSSRQRKENRRPSGMHSALTLSGWVFPSFLSRVPFQYQELSRAENSEFQPANQTDSRPSLQMQPSVPIWFRKLGGILAVGLEPCHPLHLTPGCLSPQRGPSPIRDPWFPGRSDCVPSLC